MSDTTSGRGSERRDPDLTGTGDEPTIFDDRTAEPEGGTGETVIETDASDPVVIDGDETVVVEDPEGPVIVEDASERVVVEEGGEPVAVVGESRADEARAEASDRQATADPDTAVIEETVVVDEDAERAASEAAAQARLDEAVQRAAAVPLPDDDLPAPVHADAHAAADGYVGDQPTRRETYVAADDTSGTGSSAAAGAAVGAAAGASAPGVGLGSGGYQAPQTIYVQAPEPPRTQGNRGFGVLVALVGAAVFAALYAGAAYLLLLGQARADAGEVFVEFVSRPVYWVPIIATFVGFALLAVIVNRGPYWAYAVFGLLVGVLTYFSYIGASLITVQAWSLTLEQAQQFIGQRWLDPFAIFAGIIAREMPVWLGGWLAARGRTVTQRNREATEAYERELAAGPKPVENSGYR